MTIFLVMAQQKILRSPGLTVPFLSFYYISNLLKLTTTLFWDNLASNHR